MQFRILGPLEVLDSHGRPLALGGAKQRALLAVLLLHAGKVVSADRLIDELWGENPPATARSVLQVYVANLRKVLEPGRSRRAAGAVLRTQAPGYLVDLGPDELDLLRFERLATEGRTALAADDPAQAARRLHDAEALWRGPALADVVLAGSGHGELIRLQERRLVALEDRIEAELALGRHAGLVGELQALVTAHPLRERLHSQLMLALYRSGRQAEALEAYRRTRETLAEELGIDPSPPLQQLERAILAQDPDLVPPALGPARTERPPIVRDGPIGGGGAAVSPDRRVSREERKVVTALACELLDPSGPADAVDPEDLRAGLRPYQALARAELERFGGRVERTVGPELMAVFGVPVAHEDDPERAVRAALAIRDALAELHQARSLHQAASAPTLEIQIGITTGEALVVVDSTSDASEAAITGALIASATRLQQAAPPGTILADETTFRATERAIEYGTADPIQAKGKGVPVKVWQARGPRASLGVDVAQVPRATLVGRQHELDLLRAALARARGDGVPQFVTLVGAPGIGKSRLVWELLQTVEADPELVTWRQGRCLPYGEGVALWALGEIVKAQVGILESDPAGQASAKLTQAVADLIGDQAEAAWVIGHLRPLVGLAGEADADADRRAEAFTAWRRFVEALAEQGPAVLVVEDLHWADELLLDFLDHLVDWVDQVPLLVVATARPELLARRPGWGGGKPNSAIVSLSSLSETDTAWLVGRLLGQALLPSQTQAALLARSGGNPLYAEEYVRMLADRGYLTRTGSGWRLDPAEELPLPESVQGIIAARLDSLTPEDKALLQDAAVVGNVVWLGALAALSDIQPLVLEERLHALERREFLCRARRSQVAGERQYAFRHVLVRDVAYGQLPRAARADKHLRAAQWLRTLSPDRAEDRAELLAHHYSAALDYALATGRDPAGLAEPARLALREAGDRALQLNAFQAAARWYTAALKLWPAGDPDRPRLLLRLGRARFHAEDAGTDVLAEAADGLLAQGDQEGAAEAEALLSLLAWWQRQGTDRAMHHARRAVALVEQTGPSPAKAYALAALASSLGMAGQPEPAIRAGRQVLAVAETLGLDEQRVRALFNIGSARVLGGDPGGIADLEQAVAAADAATSWLSAVAYANLGLSVISLGELGRGFEAQAKAREAAERFGLTADLRSFRPDQIGEHYLSGRWDTAVAEADQFITESQASAPHVAEPTCRLMRGRIRMARGDLAGALEDTATGLELARAVKDPGWTYPLLAFDAHALLAADRTERANAQADELLAELTRYTVLVTAPDWSGDLAIVLEALGRGSELLDLMAGVPTPTRWFRAAVAIAAGRFEEAADRYAEIGSLPDEAFARLRAAEQLLTAGQPAEGTRHLQRAVAFYREVRASAYLRDAEALLAASA